MAGNTPNLPPKKIHFGAKKARDRCSTKDVSREAQRAIADSSDTLHPEERSMRTKSLLTGFVGLLLVFTCKLISVAAEKAGAHAEKETAELRQYMSDHFGNWDRNHDGVLDLKESRRLVEKPKIRGREAALAVLIHRRLFQPGDPKHKDRLTRDELLALTSDQAFLQEVNAYCSAAESIHRELFLPGDPNLSTFHQGYVGDCYFLAGVAAAVSRDPQTIRNMIHPSGKMGFEVAFGDGQKIALEDITDAELLLGARVGEKQGIWLAILEKAYGELCYKHALHMKGKHLKGLGKVPLDGLSVNIDGPDVISVFTGKEMEWRPIKKSFTPDQLHKRFVELTGGRRLIAVGTEKDARVPPSISDSHAYAILGYDRKKRQVKIFNPWGNDFKPDGKPGLAKGYQTEHGLFFMPLSEFQTVFSYVYYETDKPYHVPQKL